MSPEQCRGRDVDQRCDIYSFGMLSYRLLTGAYPFDGALIDILHHQMYDEPPPPSSKNPQLSPEIDAAIAWMIKKHPDERPPNLITAVLALQGDRSSTPMLTPSSMAEVISPVRSSPQLGTRARRRWIAPVAGIAVLAAVAAVYVVVTRTEVSVPVSVVEPAAPPVDAAPIAPRLATTPDASITAQPSVITVDVRGVPAGTEVLVAGAVVATAPGPVQLPRGADKVVLMFRAEGYTPQSRTVRPDADQPLKLVLKKKRGQARPATSDDDDVIHVFGRENQ
jgi:hypothetical protein